jgi:Domain of unknown function (DUF4342)
MTTTETVPGSKLAARVEQLVHEGTVRYITIKHEGHTIAKFLVAVGVVGALVAPAAVATGALAALVTDCTIEVERDAEAPGATTPQADRPHTETEHLPSPGMGAQCVLISTSGMRLFEQGVIGTALGSLVVDLASAPIEPGEYRLDIKMGVGSVAIYLPHYVHVTLDGGPTLGGRTTTHEVGAEGWARLTQALQGTVRLPEQVPDFALTPPDPEHPVTIHIGIHIGVGGADIYRL